MASPAKNSVFRAQISRLLFNFGDESKRKEIEDDIRNSREGNNKFFLQEIAEICVFELKNNNLDVVNYLVEFANELSPQQGIPTIVTKIIDYFFVDPNNRFSDDVLKRVVSFLTSDAKLNYNNQESLLSVNNIKTMISQIAESTKYDLELLGQAHQNKSPRNDGDDLDTIIDRYDIEEHYPEAKQAYAEELARKANEKLNRVSDKPRRNNNAEQENGFLSKKRNQPNTSFQPTHVQKTAGEEQEFTIRKEGSTTGTAVFKKPAWMLDNYESPSK